MREPLLHFVALGLLIGWGTNYWNDHSERYTIHIGAAERQHITNTYLLQFGQPPQPAQLDKLIDRYVRDEILLREGLALGLDRNDEIVRRRIIQKYEFLRSDLAVPEQPAPAVLERWFDENRQRYVIPERVAFAQIYFSADRLPTAESARGSTAGKVNSATQHHSATETAPSRALQALAQLRRTHASRAPDLGDPFPGPADVGALTQEDAVRLFGESNVSQQLFEAPIGQWSGPFRSGYGWHLVHVTNRRPPQLPSFQEVRERVLADYLTVRREALNTQNFGKLRDRYTIIEDVPDR
ncbi:MAG TPA: peptidylprolyl isomerase [Steroidobacteraceae bacterium]|nr:peptidylprolyl isomerase [Steroidobacteraceae bacterium]